MFKVTSYILALLPSSAQTFFLEGRRPSVNLRLNQLNNHRVKKISFFSRYYAKKVYQKLKMEAIQGKPTLIMNINWFFKHSGNLSFDLTG